MTTHSKDTMTPKLPPLPCPFCGGECDPEGWLGERDGHPYRGPECNDCGATAESVEAWNRRTAIAAQGVPDGYIGSAYCFNAHEHTVVVEFSSSSQAEAYHSWLASAPPAPQAAPNRAGMTYYKNDDCKAPSADHPDCICWTPAPQSWPLPGWEVQQAAVVQQEPLGFISPKQVERIADPEGEFGEYIPMRKTSAGNFTLAVYTHPAQQAKPLRLQLAEMVDAAMVEMRNITPPLKRSECERLIWAALQTRTIEEPRAA